MRIVNLGLNTFLPAASVTCSHYALESRKARDRYVVYFPFAPKLSQELFEGGRRYPVISMEETSAIYAKGIYQRKALILTPYRPINLRCFCRCAA